MKIFSIILILLVISCGYPDIDSVPDFNNIKLTDEELIELCSTKSSANNNELCKS